MALALYRRYRPDTFEGVIGQDQVTVPLMRALDEGKLTHAYLFSGPRGCGKTSSARILARCVNCAKGPTSHPCGECESCKDLATGGPGSIDVVEIDAASHNGVDDARELRERAGFAPARDRYKIFILDEAHMVTQQGFNALLKIVEEPPEHVMFIFATTEPDKVIGTIRSRTHHYPFRLVPQEVMGPYLETICDKEGIKPEPGVLKLAMRAGGGSMRDTLSVLDQLMVGSVEGVITHDAAVALLGFTPEALIGEAVDAVIDHNGEALYGVIQKVVVGGFDPRRFVEDLLARVRDLLVLTLAGDRAESVLSDTAEAEDMDDLHRQAKALGLGALTAMADIINTTLGAMTGAISPRMRLELLAARLLAGSESGFATAAPAPASSGMPPAAASSTSTTPAASGMGASGFAGASRGGFAGASHGGFSGAARNQQAAAPQSTASHESVGGNGPVSDRPADSPSVQPAVATAAAGAGWGAPAASPAVPAQPVTSPAASDNRSIDEKWDAAVAALPETIREYVSRDKVPTVKFGPNRKGLPCLSMTFDKSLSQHAFALAVDNSGKKAAAVVMDAVRNEFGANAVIAPSAVAANGERVESVKRMSPEQLAKVKQQIAMAKAGLAASSLGASLDIHMGSETKAPKPTATGQAEDADDSHRAGQSSASTAAKNWSDDDPWAKPAVSNASPQSADGFAPNEPAATPAPEEHHKKHVAVPDISDGVDPWAAPAAPVAPTASVASAGPTGQSTGQPATASSVTAVAGASDDPWNQTQSQAAVSPASQPAEADPWNQPYQQSPHDDPWNQPQGNQAQAAPQPGDDPWNQPQSQTPASSVPQTVSGNMSGDDPWNQPQSVPQPAAGDDPWNQPQPAQPTPNADPWNSQPQPQPKPQPQVAAEDDEYSMSDQSLGEATAMNLDDLKKLFEVKKVEQFAADDPKNPKNIQPAKKHSDE
ncbi:DNA polymerase III subunit gamma and tau [Bifidobacterium longum]|uniref:DNA polymerase III subunit gamma and tau n=1 Tax=Bifidobacterium longum TaxID=216816 RepID=UPI001040A57B|nr:DNA polymerase III subunit gamma and tau [Bifidobacterium longum]TCF84465.1 DNA polymerase III subunits gamma and tau [Bifidobacterium longum subsp. longum]